MAPNSTKVLVVAFGFMIMLQLGACNWVGHANDGDSIGKPEVNASPEKGLPLLVVSRQQRQSSGANNNNQPDFFLIWLQPYQDNIPKPVMDMIDQQVRPQTQQITQQVLSRVPGAQDFWSQLSQFQNTINNMGGLQSIISGAVGGRTNPFSGTMQGLGRR